MSDKEVDIKAQRGMVCYVVSPLCNHLDAWPFLAGSLADGASIATACSADPKNSRSSDG